MNQLIFCAVTGFLALMALQPDSLYIFYGVGAVIGPLAIPLAYLWVALPTLWFAGTSFALINKALRSYVPALLPRMVLTTAGVAFIGFGVFFALPALNGAYQSHRADRFTMGDLPAPSPLPAVRRIEIRVLGAHGPKNPYFAPTGCFDLCIDLLAAGVLDQVIIRTAQESRAFSREQVAQGCRSPLFSRKHQGRAFRLQLAGVCLVSAPVPQDAAGFDADVTFVMLDDWQNRRFQSRQIQAFDKAGTLLMQQSEVAWQEGRGGLPVASLLSDQRTAPIQHKAGHVTLPFGWPEMAGLLGLPQGGLKDSALRLPIDTDPTAITPPDVSFRMLELLAEKGALTDTERLVLVSMVLKPGFRPSEMTAQALHAVIAAKPQYGKPMAAALERATLDQIAEGQFYADPSLMQSLAQLRTDLPSADLPPVLAQFDVAQLNDRWSAGPSLAIAATGAGAAPARYLLPILRQAELEAANFRSPETHPAVIHLPVRALNAAICTHADGLREAGEIWLSWASHHAAVVSDDRNLATEFGVTGAHLGLPIEKITARFALIAGWTAAETADLAQPPAAPCPG